jgi:hypothetical protein
MDLMVLHLFKVTDEEGSRLERRLARMPEAGGATYEVVGGRSGDVVGLGDEATL